MLRTFVLFVVCVGIFSTGRSVGLSSRFLHKTTTEQPTELAATTTAETTASNRLPAGYYKSKNLPQVEKDCEIIFECKKKLKTAETPRPCTKYCVKSINCAHNKKIPGVHGQCVELNEELVAQEYNDCKKDDEGTQKHIMQVAMIDFPCQPGYLPDSRGRCREVW